MQCPGADFTGVEFFLHCVPAAGNCFDFNPAADPGENPGFFLSWAEDVSLQLIRSPGSLVDGCDVNPPNDNLVRAVHDSECLFFFGLGACRRQKGSESNERRSAGIFEEHG
ncbi:MAG: hypothetical protein UW75_C0023G0009 [Parcubacteria group bacterium GW2011_GWF2_44_8]|nr:MAG: hypothetical protein UW75_C0023G0009 [Parcubacteria group bacterium GW2011_GWF2_44_8]